MSGFIADMTKQLVTCGDTRRTTLVRLSARRRLGANRREILGAFDGPLLMARKLALSFTSANTVGRGFEPPGRTAHRVLKWVKNAETSLLSAPLWHVTLAVAQVGPLMTPCYVRPRMTLARPI